MNRISISIIKSGTSLKTFSYSLMYHMSDALKKTITCIQNEYAENEIEGIEIQLFPYKKHMPSIVFDEEILSYVYKNRIYVKLIFRNEKLPYKGGVMKAELNITGQFVPNDISRLLNRKSDYEYSDKSFRTENGWGEKHSAWCAETTRYRVREFGAKTKDFLNYFLKYNTEILHIKKQYNGYFILDFNVFLESNCVDEVTFDWEIWDMLERLQVDCVDFDVYYK